MGAPFVRARHPQMLLAIVQAQRPEIHAETLRRLSDGQRLQSTLPIEWLPISIDIELIERLAEALPPGALDEMTLIRQRQELGSALFKTFVATVGRLLGFTPATLMRQLDKGWRQVFRDCGGIEVASLEAQSARARVIGLPRECLASRAWIGCIPVGMRAVFELIKMRVDVNAALVGDAVELRFNWSGSSKA